MMSSKIDRGGYEEVKRGDITLLVNHHHAAAVADGDDDVGYVTSAHL